MKNNEGIWRLEYLESLILDEQNDLNDTDEAYLQSLWVNQSEKRIQIINYDLIAKS